MIQCCWVVNFFQHKRIIFPFDLGHFCTYQMFQLITFVISNRDLYLDFFSLFLWNEKKMYKEFLHEGLLLLL